MEPDVSPVPKQKPPALLRSEVGLATLCHGVQGKPCHRAARILGEGTDEGVTTRGQVSLGLPNRSLSFFVQPVLANPMTHYDAFVDQANAGDPLLWGSFVDVHGATKIFSCHFMHVFT